MPSTYITTDDGGAAQSLSVLIAAALGSMKRHMKIRRLPNFVDKSFLSKLERNDPCASLRHPSLRHPSLLRPSPSGRLLSCGHKEHPRSPRHRHRLINPTRSYGAYRSSTSRT